MLLDMDKQKQQYSDKSIVVVTHGDIVVAIQEYLNQENEAYPKSFELFEYEI